MKTSRAFFAVVGFALALSPLAGAAAGEAPLPRRTDLPALRYTNATARIPNYLPGKKWGTQGEAFNDMQLPLSPAESAPHLVTRPEFVHQLWAAEPDITKPICMAWDERGRLWIAETVDYPNEQQEPGKGRDRLKICEDTDGDGKADKFTIFADKLSIPTGMVFANGGVIVIQGGQTLFLRDYTGDDKADEREVLFSGWGMKDTHATASNLRWGHDNWIWGTVGYSGFDGFVRRQRVKFAQGVFRFKPDGSALEFVKSSNNNTWGLGLSEEGLIFGSTANNNASWFMPIANRYYEAVSGWSASRMESIADSQAFYPITDRVRQVDAHGRYTAGAGHALYTARSFPKSYWNKAAFVAEPTGHLVGQFRLEPRGSDFVAVNEHTFLASDDEWCAPIMAEVGPDGALWVIDWYNYIIQHNPTPAGFQTGKGNAYETPLRDQRHGRIYRVVAKDAPAAPKLNLAKANPEQLVATLRHDNMLWRLHAQRLMIERAKRDVVPSLHALARDPAVDEIGLNPAAIHALWTLHGLGLREATDQTFQTTAVQALRHASAGVRRTAAMVLPRNEAATRALVAAGLLGDPDAQVRLAAFLALAEMPPSDETGAAVLLAMRQEQNTKDRWIPEAATAAAARHDAGFLKAVLTQLAGAGSPLSDPLHNAIRIVTGHYAQRAPVDSAVPTLLALHGAAPAVALPFLDGLAAHWPRAKAPVFQPGEEARLAALMKVLPDEARSSLLTLADRWEKRGIFASEVAAIAKGLRDQLANPALDDVARADAARRLVGIADGPDTVGVILGQITPLAPPALAGGLINALGGSKRAPTGSAILAQFDKFTPATRRAATAVLMRRTEWASALLNSIEKKQLQRTDIAADHWTQLKSNPDGFIVAKAREVEKLTGGSASSDMDAVVKKLLPIARQPGDAAQGKELFTKNCAVCHAFNGQGAKVGPDLDGISARPRQDVLVDIIDPNRNVEANYRLWNVSTRTGDTFSGRLDTETATTVEILDTAGQKHVVQRKEIVELNASALSIMPAGFDQLPAADLAALLEYLATTASEAKK